MKKMIYWLYAVGKQGLGLLTRIQDCIKIRCLSIDDLLKANLGLSEQLHKRKLRTTFFCYEQQEIEEKYNANGEFYAENDVEVRREMDYRLAEYF